MAHFRVVDVSMFERRGDGHVSYGDCLHYCKPGTPDFWNKQILNHIIIEFRLHSEGNKKGGTAVDVMEADGKGGSTTVAPGNPATAEGVEQLQGDLEDLWHP